MKETYNLGFKDINGNPVPDSQATPEIVDMINSTGDYRTDCKNHVCAYCANGTRMLLNSIGRTQVRFVAGLWRVQRVHSRHYKITDVRDKQFILGKKLDIHEKNLFEYYEAADVVSDCYGILPPAFTYIVAKYDTKDGAVMSYGVTVEQARAFLGIALFDKYNSAVHSVARREKQSIH
ncbi:MAG: hypothetical protein J5608_02745 [Alphaproteobacteria bacterium]|nr:hypothetical protein [Alphaproteobacteria bacterium]